MTPSTTSTNLHRLLISGGDSGVFGTGLSDHANKFDASNLTWPALLAKHQNRQYLCVAQPGYSNMAIARTVINACQQNRDKDLFVAVSWTFLNRFEFRFAYDPWANKDGSKDLEFYSSWFNFSSRDLGDTERHIAQSKKSTLRFVEDFYRHVAHDTIYEYYATLKEIVFLQNYLKVNSIPYVFTLLHNFFNKDIHDHNVQALYQQIDFEPWYFFPPLRGFISWALENNYEITDCEHPSDLAHQDAVSLIKEFINEKV